MLASKLYHYRAELVSIYDGDTITVDLDLGCGVWKRKEKIRLWGINTPEIRTRNEQEKAAGYAAKARLTELLGSGDLLIQTFREKETGKFGRLLGIVWSAGVNCNQRLIDEGHATEYFSGSRDMPKVAP